MRGLRLGLSMTGGRAADAYAGYSLALDVLNNQFRRNNQTYTSLTNAGVTVSRTGTATYTDSSGVIQSASANAPRYDYDPSTLRLKGLLIEGARTNILLNSAIDGTALSTQSVTVTATAYTLSFYGSGTVTLSGTSTAGPLVGTGAYPNRVQLTFTPTAGTLTLTVSGDVKFAQLEAGAFASSFIPTAGASVTRNADVISMTGANFSDWFNPVEGTFVVQGSNFCTSGVAYVVAASDGTSSNRVIIYRPSSTNVDFVVSTAATAVANIRPGANVNANTVFRAACSYKQDDFAGAANGRAEVTDTSGAVPIVNKLSIGSSENGGSSYFYGHVAQLFYYNTRRTDRSDLSVEQYNSPFPYISRPGINVGAMQGVASSNQFYFTSSGASNTGNRTIRTYDKNWNLVTSRDTQLDNGAAHSQANGLYYDIATNKLYSGASNFPTTPKGGWILEYDANTSTGVLSFVAAHPVGAPNWTEGCTKYNGYFWVVFHDLNEIHQYDTSWTLVQAHTLSPTTDPVNTTSNPDLWQSIIFQGDTAFVNMHGDNPLAPRIDAHRWNGSGFTFIAEKLLPPTRDCTQGFHNDGSNVLWAQRLDNDPTASAQVIKSSFNSSKVPGF